MSKALVSIVMGSDSDLDVMREAATALEGFGIGYEIDVTSAHRSPERTAEYAQKAASRGIRVIIAGAGGAAHLAGVIAMNVMAVLLVWRLLASARRRPTFWRNLAFHWTLVAWLSWFAFPW